MTYIFFVQGEGRGHLTQALTLKAKLEERGHTIAAVIAGPDPDHGLPAFFEEQFAGKLIRISSPAFVIDKNGQGINMLASIIQTIRKLRHYHASLKLIRQIIKEKNPDALVNFYEPLAGIYARLYRDQRPLFCIGHQYFIGHPAFQYPSSRTGDKTGISFYNRLTAPRRSFKIALSFSQEKDIEKQRLFVCPPLIRQLIKDQAPSKGGFILAYLLNVGYSQEIIAWSAKNPGVKIHAFWNKPESGATELSADLTFHELHGEKFIGHLVNCDAYVSTAGFDSIAEAAYLQKDVLMIPTKHHFEQKCNAQDAKRTGIAISSDRFDLSLLIEKEKTHSDAALSAFKEWVDDYDDKIIGILER